MSNQTAIDRFNPDALRLQAGDQIIQLGIHKKQKYNIYLARPQGDFLSHLLDEVERIPETQPHITHDKKEIANIVLGIAALEQVISPEAIRVVEQELKYLMPRIDFFWRSLELFRATTRYANAHSIELPRSMQDARQAWGRSVLRSVGGKKHPSKKSYRDVLSGSAKDLKQKQNPFGDDCPEDREFVEYALRFQHWDKAIRDTEASLPNYDRRRLGALRKDVRDALSNYERSMSAYSSYLKTAQNLLSVQFDPQGRCHVVGEKGKLSTIDE